MNLTMPEVEELLRALRSLVDSIEDVEIAVCPPFPYLAAAVSLLEGSGIGVGAQNMAEEAKGAFTGEVSGLMLKDIGCRYVILGHSERRHVFHESDAQIQRKIRKAIDFGLKPILCVGELLEEREAGRTESVVEGQLRGCLEGIENTEVRNITLAYEPVWAIGTGKTATPDQAQDVHAFIRDWISTTVDRDSREAVRIQYGGSVKPENARELMAQEDIDGALVGGASLQAGPFAAIVEAARK